KRIADAEGPEGSEPDFNRFLPEAAAAAGGDDTLAFRRDADGCRLRFREHRRGRAGIELRSHRPAVDFNRELDRRPRSIVSVETNDARSFGRPVREVLAFAIARLEQPDRVVREIEFDVGPAQEILAENDGDVRAEFMLARNQHAPVAAHFRTKRKLVDGNRLDGAFAADPD